MNQILNILYKGERDYIHGTDIVDNCEKFIGQLKKNIENNLYIKSYLFKKKITNAPVLSDKTKDIDPSCVVTLSDESKFFIYESKLPVIGNYSYNENLIYENIKKISDLYTVENNSEFSTIEIIVATNKYALRENYGNHNFLFTEIEIQQSLKVIKDNDALSIKPIKNLFNKFFISDILVNNYYFGTIKFIST